MGYPFHGEAAMSPQQLTTLTIPEARHSRHRICVADRLQRCWTSCHLVQLVNMRFAPAATVLRYWTKYPDGCGFFEVRPDGNQQAVKLGHKERRTRPRNCRDACGSVVNRAFRFQNIDEAGAAAHVNAAALRVDAQVIIIPAAIVGRYGLAVRR